MDKLVAKLSLESQRDAVLMNSIKYDYQSRTQFGEAECRILDALNERFGIVELVPPAAQDAEWFVQVYRNPEDDLPVGVYGASPHDAASKLAAALRISLE